ncbi:MAG TPA: division/cell wall cluster transcriptional repressor MraZ, partial [Salinimicrobium sp.]|nr:division/cell wall cluster transcriptional repressor MraZ [Salinimicrobium sp.]
KSVFEPCLELYPMQEWNLLVAKMNKLNKFQKKNNDFIRKFTAGVKTVEVDTNGRLLIPKDLMGFADIKKDITMASALNIIEIWDKNKYDEAVKMNDDDFAALAEEIMGNENDHEIS